MVTVLALLVAAAPAGAATVRVDSPGAALAFDALPGEANDVTVSFDAASTTWRVTDAGAPLIPGAGCTLDGTTATCSGSGPARATIRLGDGNDRIAMPAAHDGIDIGGGDGDDQITLGPGAGTANLHGDGGADTIHSDAPNATLDYSGSSASVNVVIDGQPLDGSTFERDNDTGTFATIVGSPFNDELDAGTNPTIIEGGAGTDTLIGGPGNDRFVPGPGNDSVYGAGGDDTAVLEGFNQMGFYSGGPGDDTLTVDQQDAPFFDVFANGRADDGGPGRGVNVQADWESITVPRGTVTGGSINETITVLDGTANGARGNDHVIGGETLVGGRGRDAFTLTKPDTNVVKAVDGEVDRIDCRKGIPKSIAMDPIDKAPGCGPAFELSGPKTLRPSGGFLMVRLSCDSPAPALRCRSKVSIARGSTVYASGATTTIATGDTARVRLKLSARGKRGLASGRKLTGDLTVAPATSGHGLTLPALLGRVVIR